MKRKPILLAALLAASIQHLNATPVMAVSDSFGSEPTITFGGTGIPNDAVAKTTINAKTVTGADAVISLYLTAHQRYENAPLANNGAGVFTALAGLNNGDPSGNTTPSPTLGATWNFAWTAVVSGGTFNDFAFKVFYDFNPATGSDQLVMSSLNLNSPFVGSQGSQNSAFSFLDPTTPNGITATSFGVISPGSQASFNPFAAGEYGIALVAYGTSGELGRSAILVNTTSASVPETGPTVGLLAFGLGTLVLIRRKLVPATA